MNIEFNPLLPRPQLTDQSTKLGIGKGEQSFEDVLKGAIKDVNRLQTDSDLQMTRLMKGESQDLHATILAVKEADTSFRMMMSVRNKIVEAYKEISRTGM